MKQASSDDKADTIGQRIGGTRQLRPMSVAVKDRKYCNDRGGRGKRQAQPHGDGRSENESGQRDHHLRHRQWDL